MLNIQNKKRYLLQLSLYIFATLFTLLTIFSPRALAATKPALIMSHSNLNPGEPGFKWQIYRDQGFTLGTIFPNGGDDLDNSAVKLTILPAWPYSDLHAYVNVPPANNATQFAGDYSFFFPQTTGMQALEFKMKKWVANQEWEWSVQWELLPDGTSQQGQPMSWRVWNGMSWINTGITQNLATNSWHTLHLDGAVVNGQSQYLSMRCDDNAMNLQAFTFAPVSSPGEKLAIAVQLDGDALLTPYTVFFERASLRWAKNGQDN